MARPLKPEMVRYLHLLDELCAEGRSDSTRHPTPSRPSMAWPPPTRESSSPTA
ncbi:hypothetical protein [Leptolyngbya iicbica]|uniref:hypothetical protein n=1 Tax=Leptolyngbya iicbica TaxID=3161580 RepID=UPI001A91FC5E|nr:hypothetical protein [Leptolyngbya sp. LK]